MTPFENKKIRCLQVAGSKKWYFSVVDVCAAIRGTDYDTSRNYWKWLKSKLTKAGCADASAGKASKQPVSSTNQLKLPAADGKLRYTDVMDVQEILKLLQQIPSPKAVTFRLWLISQLQAGKNLSKQLLHSLVDADFAKELKDAVIAVLGRVVMLKTVYKSEFLLC